jgi:hypothetical protein
MGKPAEEAAIALRIAPTIGVNLSHRIKILNERFHLEPSKRDPHAGSKMDNCSFLSRFGDAAWTRFLSTAQKIDAAKATLYLWPPDVLQRDGLRMIGSSRQILLATEVHYAWAKAFLKAVELTTDNIRCVHSVGASQAHLALARKYGFDPTSPKSAGDDKSRRTTAIYPDVEIDSEGARITRDRCAIILKESDSQPLRSALEFALLACIVISWLTENSNQMTP